MAVDLHNTRATSIAPAPTGHRNGGGSTSLPTTVQFTLAASTIRFLWVLVFVVQSCSAGLAATVGVFYFDYNYAPGSALHFVARTFLLSSDVAFLDTYSPWIGTSYLLLAVIYLISLFKMLWNSIRFRRLWFASIPTHQSIGPSKHLVNAKASHTCSQYSCRCLISGVFRLWVEYGVRGPHFEQGLLIRDAIEMLTLTLQAYWTSRMISNALINQAYGMLIAMSAISNPLLSRIFARNLAMKRFACVISAFIIDILWGTVLPALMSSPYFMGPRTETSDSIMETRGPDFYVMAQREVRHILILSRQTYVLSMFPLVSTLVTIRSFNRLLASAKRVESPRALDRDASAAPQELSSVSGGRKSLLVAVHHRHQILSSKILWWGHAVIVLYGLGILAISISSRNRKLHVAAEDCLYPLWPWFASEIACAGWVINCTSMSIQGHREELTSAFEKMYTDSLGCLKIVNCAFLEIPPAVANYPNLVTVLMENSTLVDWAAEVALSSSNFPNLQSLGLLSMAFAPQGKAGLFAGDWPSSLIRFAVINSDMNELADMVTTQWRHITRWYCVYCQLTTVPIALFRAKNLVAFVIIGTGISTISAPPITTSKHTSQSTSEDMIWPSLRDITLDANPRLTTLDEFIWEHAASGALATLSVMGTNISTIPAHWAAHLPASLSIYGSMSPLCADGSRSKAALALNCTRPKDDYLQYQSPQ